MQRQWERLVSSVLSGRDLLRTFYQPRCGWLISEVPAGQKRVAPMANVPPLARAVLVLMGFIWH
jgi:hypothetical protein